MSIDDLAEGLELLRDAAPAYEKAEKYYNGSVPEIFASLRMRRLLRRSGISYRTNFAKLPTKVVANRLRIAAVTASAAKPEIAEQAQQALNEMWSGNQMGLHTKSWHLRTGMYGDGFVIVWPNERIRGGVQISYNSPLTTRIVYDPEDQLTKLYAVKEWCERGGLRRANIYYDDWIERWATTGDDPVKAKWEPWVDPEEEDGQAEIVNPFGQMPVFHLRTDLPYGIPDHIDAYGIQDAINKLTVVLIGTVDFYGFPQRAALENLEASRDEITRDDLWEDEDEEDGDRDDDGQAATIRSSPEVLWVLKNIAELVQLPAGDPQVFIQPAAWLVRAMAQITETPVRHMDPQGDVPSGESQRAADAPLNKRVEDRQAFFGTGHEEYSEFALKVWAHANGANFDDVRVDVRWEPPEQTDTVDEWTVAQSKLDAGVPPKVVLVEAGYAPETVDQWIAETPAIELRPRIDLLVQIAQAAQGLGASSAMGVIDAGLVQKAIAALTSVDGGGGGAAA